MSDDGHKIFHKLDSSTFDNAKRVEYKQASSDKPVSWRRISRTNLIGQFGEPCGFHLRMFVIAPGGFSSFEKHQHVHAVICESGEGFILLENTWHRLHPGDVVYVGSETAHQFRCKEDVKESFIFYCIVNAERDKPTILEKPSKLDL